MSREVLAVTDLEISFATESGRYTVVEGVSFSINTGEVLGLVGESGCGKSVTAMSLVSLLPSPPSHREKGSIKLSGKEIAGLPESELQKIRGAEVGFIFQEPMSSLNPVLTIGYQLSEALLLHQKINKKQAHEKAVEMLNLVGVSDPELRTEQYPHELSGGQRQRVMIAMALALEPEILIADEPTTALDVVLQRQILDLLKQLQHHHKMAILLISHDLSVVKQYADEVLVVNQGRIEQQGDINEIFHIKLVVKLFD